MLKMLGYPDRYSVAPGEEISFHVSAQDNQGYEARLVRVICGDCNPEGPGLQFENIDCAANGAYQGRRQDTDAGSYMEARVKQLENTETVTFAALVWPTLPARTDQTVCCIGEDPENRLRLSINEGVLSLSLECGGGTHSAGLAETPVLKRQWYAVSFSFNRRDGAFTLRQTPLKTWAQVKDGGALNGTLAAQPNFSSTAVMLAGAPAGRGRIDAHFDGKIESPMLFSGAVPAETVEQMLSAAAETGGGAGADMLARWDFSQDMTTVKAVDVSDGGNHGHFVNAPARAMKGARWDGAFHRWTERPDHYGAVHFHHDDLYDAKWEKAFSWEVPEGFASGAYAMQIICGENTRDATLEYHIPFFVRPPRRPAGTAGTRNRIAFLAPTASYMAYANHAEHITAREAERVIGRLLQFGHADMYMYDHPEIGLSLYDSHLDGSGVCYSSRLRPVLNFTSQYHSWLGGHGSALWQYNADTHLLAWLEHKGFEFDVITDEDLHEEGAHLLEDYRVVLTGTHPEYYSEKMWNGLKSWIDAGGRLMYLGANGFYWHIAFSDDMPGLMEVRRAEDGIRTWAAEPGEYYHSFNGAMGGLYRRRGRPPNEIGGVGFIAQGFDLSSYYRRAPGADDPRVRFIFEGVDDEIIGDFGLIGGGAAGLELDCITKELGSPPNIIKLASSENHTSLVMLVNEEFGVVPPNLGGDQNDKVRADLAFFETPAGGAVFATGSIAWCGALPVKGFDNNVSKITENVLRRFADPKPFETG